MDFVSDSLANGRRLKFLTVADDFSYECIDIAVDFGISGAYVSHLIGRCDAPERNPLRSLQRLHGNCLMELARQHRVAPAQNGTSGSRLIDQAVQQLRGASTHPVDLRQSVAYNKAAMPLVQSLPQQALDLAHGLESLILNRPGFGGGPNP
jgi:hypothetical protein